ncbi:MATE family efflux transporter [bacterium]|nr:MATE family efflux transporter [bacterium]
MLNRNPNPDIFEGPIRKPLIRLALPMLAGMLFNLLYNLVDAMWISMIDRNDPSWFGGTGLIFPLLFIAIALSNGLMVGISSLVARGIGEKNHDVLDKTAESGLAVGFILSVIIVVGSYLFDKELITMLGAEGDLYQHALDYFHFIIPGTAIIFMVHVFGGILQGEGNMKPLIQAMIIGTILNLVLDPIFIFWFNLDVRGAALATCISRLVSLILVVRIFLQQKSSIRIHWKLSNISLSVIKQINYLGIPHAMGQVFMSVNVVILNRIIISVDETAITSFSLVGRFDQLILIPIFALSSAVISIAGQNAGRGNIKRVREVWKNGIFLGSAVVFSLATVLVLSAPHLLSLFSDNATVIHYGTMQMRILEFSFVFAVIGIIGRSIFQAVGYPSPAMFITLLRTLLIAAPASALYVFVFDLGIKGVYFGVLTGNSLSAIASFFYCRYTLNRLEDGRLEVLTTKT